jgi:phytoene dehydrogenase-like protein
MGHAPGTRDEAEITEDLGDILILIQIDGNAKAMTIPDAIVVGAGPNGLVAANVLADAGWSVELLEAQADVGGAVSSDRELDPDFVQDTFSAFYPLAVASPVISRLRLEDHGLRWRHARAVLGHPRPDGSWALLHRDLERTVAGLGDVSARDADMWRGLNEQWQQIGPDIVDALLSPFPPVRAGLRTGLRLRRVGGLSFVRMLLEPVQRLVESRFESENAQLLIAGNAGHADIPFDAPGSGLMGILLAMLGQTVGFPVPEGGAGELSRALARRLEAGGGTIRRSARVTRIKVVDGRARRVVLASGEVLSCSRAVIAAVSAPVLYGELLDRADLPARVRSGMEGFQLDPSTVKVDWALDGPVPWQSTPAEMPGTVHIADSMSELVKSLRQVSARLVPAAPFLLVGQMTTSDPTRSPPGTESLWAYTHVPQAIRDDAGGEGIRGVWDHDDAERMADRMQSRIETYAPGFASRIRARRVLTPLDLERRNASLVGGSINGGTAELHQQLVFRPIPGLRRASTPIRGLFLASASAHPGGGVHGAPGNSAARAALRSRLLRRL